METTTDELPALPRQRKKLTAAEKAEITRQLNELYEFVDSSIDPVVMQLQLTALDPEDWDNKHYGSSNHDS